jgi:hypothetical protein
MEMMIGSALMKSLGLLRIMASRYPILYYQKLSRVIKKEGGLRPGFRNIYTEDKKPSIYSSPHFEYAFGYSEPIEEKKEDNEVDFKNYNMVFYAE